MGRLGQDKPAFGWELEPLPLLLYRAVTLCSHPKAGLSWPSLPILPHMGRLGQDKPAHTSAGLCLGS